MQKNTAVLINTQKWSVDNISDIDINYTSDKIYVLPSTDNQIILKEYCSQDDNAYYAIANNSDGKINIQSGKRSSDSFSFYAEVYIPDNYNGALNITTSSGKVIAQPTSDMSINEMKVTTNSGQIDIANITSNLFLLNSKSGGIEVKNTSGAINAETSSGKISASLPENESFTLSARSDSSKVTNNWGEPFTYDSDTKQLVGTNGSEAVYSVTLQTNSSSIEVNKN